MEKPQSGLPVICENTSYRQVTDVFFIGYFCLLIITTKGNGETTKWFAWLYVKKHISRSRQMCFLLFIFVC